MERAENVIELRAVNKAYRGETLFEGLNLTVRQGECCGIVGEEGAGKSTLLKIACGLLRPDSGKVVVCGEKLQKGKIPRGMGVMLDEAGFLPDETGLKNLAIIAGIRRQAAREKLEETMRSVGLDPAYKWNVRDYSPEMKQRLAMAQALMEGPRLLILDEPFHRRGRSAAKDFRKLLERLNAQEGVTMLLTASRTEEVSGLCGKLYQIEAGGLKEIGIQEAKWQSLIDAVKDSR